MSVDTAPSGSPIIIIDYVFDMHLDMMYNITVHAGGLQNYFSHQLYFVVGKSEKVVFSTNVKPLKYLCNRRIIPGNVFQSHQQFSLHKVYIK